jgi:hypothetical protein
MDDISREAEAVEDDKYMRMTPNERIQEMFRLREEKYPGSSEQPMARVCRIVKLADG